MEQLLLIIFFCVVNLALSAQLSPLIETTPVVMYNIYFKPTN